MNKRVVITGLGVISSIGIGWREFWDSLLEGKSGISPVLAIDTTNHFTHNGGEVKNFKPEEFMSRDKIPLLSRASQLGLAAAKLAVTDCRLSHDDSSRAKIGTCIGITSGSVQVIEHINDKRIKNEEIKNELICQLPVQTTSAVIARELGFNGPNILFSKA